MKERISLTKSMVKGHSFGQMGGNTLDSGGRANSMALDVMCPAMNNKRKGSGSKERELDELIQEKETDIALTELKIWTDISLIC